VTWTFTISAPTQVSVASYIVRSTSSTFPQVLYNSQTLFDSSTGTYPAGTYSLSAQIPTNGCHAQVDLVKGPAIGPILTGNGYQIFDATTGAPLGSDVADAVHVGTLGCGVIQVNKNTNPSGSSATFNFSGTLAGTIGDGGSIQAAEPAGTYTTTENVPSGWQLTSVTCTSAGATGGTTSTSGSTTTYNLVEGELLSCTYLDTLLPPPPSGPQLTIGYWKNWSSCSGGKQAPSLDKALLAAANSGNPITEGLLVLNPKTLGASTACIDAVNLLNKTTIDGKKKMASDPLFNMTAQLLGADLNVAAGAGTCAAAVSAINQAHALLVQYSFNGLGYSPKLTTSDANLANQLATTLDKYNNNLLC
jgi:hypothetical protein